MRTPNESKSSPTTPSQDIQPPVPSHPPHVSQAPVVASAAAMTAATSQTNNHANNNVGKYDESILFQLQRAPASSAMSSIPSSSLGMILAGTQSQHQKEDSLIDLNEESSYMKQSQHLSR